MNEPFPDRSVKPFRMGRVPQFPITGEALIADRENAPQNHADIIGCALFQARNDVLSTFAALIEDDQYRAKLGKVNSAPFSALAELSSESQALALTIAELGMNRMIEAFAGLLVAGERTIPGDYCVSYKLEAHVEKITGATENGVTLKGISKCVVVDSEQSVLLTSFSRWLSSFGAKSRA